MYKPTVSDSFLKREIGIVPKHKRYRGSRRRERRRRMLEQDSLCFYCLKELTLDTSTIDHCIPRSIGGTNDDSNVVLSCHGCNQSKGTKIYIKR